MTKKGIGFAVAFAVLLIAAMGTGYRELFFASFCILALLGLSFIACVFAASAVFCKISVSKTDVPRKSNIILSLDMSGFLVLPAVCDMYISLPAGKPQKSADTTNKVSCLMPGKLKKRYDIDINCADKGVWKIGVRKIRVFDIFGFFSMPVFQVNRNKYFYRTVTVHPICYPIESRGINPSETRGERTVLLNETESGSTLSGSRQYRYGDALKRINWKQSAKMRELYVRKYEPEQNPFVLIVLDAVSLYNSWQYGNLASDITATAANYYLDNYYNVRVLITGISEKNMPNEIVCDMDDVGRFSELDTLLVGTKFSVKKTPSLIVPENMSAARNASAVIVITSAPSAKSVRASGNISSADSKVSLIIPAQDEKSAQKIAADVNSDSLRLTAVTDSEGLPEILGRCLN